MYAELWAKQATVDDMYDASPSPDKEQAAAQSHSGAKMENSGLTQAPAAAAA
jgi:hypothetical protein